MSDDHRSGPTAEQPTERWVDGDPVTEVALPPDVASTASRFFGEAIGTFDDFVSAARSTAGGGPLAVDDLCHTTTETPHRATVGDERYYFQCFYDGIALAHLADEPVEIRTESPGNEPIAVRASPDGDVDVTPTGAAMSFGVSAGVQAPADGGLTPEAVYNAICPHVRAFPDRKSYERWADGVAAATVGLPLPAGVPIAAALTE